MKVFISSFHVRYFSIFVTLLLFVNDTHLTHRCLVGLLSTPCARAVGAGLLTVASLQPGLPHCEHTPVEYKGKADERPLEGVENDEGVPEELDA